MSSQVALGMVMLVDLLRAGRGATVAQLMRPTRHHLSARASLAAAHEHRGWREYHALPVMERQERFIGSLEYTVLHRAIEQPHPDDSRPVATGSLSLLVHSFWEVFANLLQALINLLPSARPLVEEKREGS